MHVKSTKHRAVREHNGLLV